MGKKLNIISALLILLLTSCSALKTVKLINAGSVVQQTFRTEIPFEQTATGHILIKVKIKGIERTFIFDTGAPNVISKELAEEIKSTSLIETKARDSQKKKQSVNMVQLDSIFIQSICFINTAALVIDLKQSNEIKCWHADGIIGNNLMRNAVWKINFDKKIITLSNDAKQEDIQSALIVPFTTEISSPKLDLQIDNIKDKNITIDFGSNGYYHTSAAVFRQLKKQGKINTYAYAYGTAASGIFGTKTDTTFYAQVPTWKMQDVSFSNNEILFSESGVKTIGCSFFKNYITTLDFKKHLMYLLKLKEPQEKKPKSYGITPNLQENKLLVGKIINTSTAYKSGIREANQILSVNDVSYENTTAEMYCNFITLLYGDVPLKIIFLSNNEKKEMLLSKEENLK